MKIPLTINNFRNSLLTLSCILASRRKIQTKHNFILNAQHQIIHKNAKPQKSINKPYLISVKAGICTKTHNDLKILKNMNPFASKLWEKHIVMVIIRLAAPRPNIREANRKTIEKRQGNARQRYDKREKLAPTMENVIQWSLQNDNQYYHMHTETRSNQFGPASGKQKQVNKPWDGKIFLKNNTQQLTTLKI